MARWAKSVNAAKVVQQQQLHSIIQLEAMVKEVTPPSAALSDLAPSQPVKGGMALAAAVRREVSGTAY